MQVKSSMNFSVNSSSRQGNASLNEDALILNELNQIYGVIDGVSSMDNYRNEANETGGYLAAQLLVSNLHAQERQDLNIKEAVTRANLQLRGLMEAVGMDPLCKWNLWSAVFAVMRIHETYIEYVQCGDCMLFIQYKDGTVRVLTRNQVEAFDTLTLNKKRELTASGLSKEEIKQELFPIIENTRNKTNTLEGYSVMNGDPAFADFIEYGQIPRANVSKIYAVTDGLFHHFEASSDPLKWDKFIADLDKWDLEHYIDHLTCIEEQDPLCQHYPRHKKSDDKTAVIVEFNP